MSNEKEKDPGGFAKFIEKNIIKIFISFDKFDTNIHLFTFAL